MDRIPILRMGDFLLVTIQVVEKGMEMLRRHIGITELDGDTSASD